MSELVLTTYDWVPPPPRGYVRDLRVRWALEEAGLPYRVESTPFDNRQAEHFAHQPFGQVPWLTDGDLSIFESGAILLHLGAKSTKLMPADVRGRAEVTEWVFGALNSIEMATMPWVIFKWQGSTGESPEFQFMDGFLTKRLDRMEAVLKGREWLTDSFSIADILMSDALRLVGRFDGLKSHPGVQAYVDRALARPAFKKAEADQFAHFEAGDAKRAG